MDCLLVANYFFVFLQDSLANAIIDRRFHDVVLFDAGVEVGSRGFALEGFLEHGAICVEYNRHAIGRLVALLLADGSFGRVVADILVRVFRASLQIR